MSKTRLLLGAAGLLLFIVGVKKTYRMGERGETLLTDASGESASAEDAAEPAREG